MLHLHFSPFFCFSVVALFLFRGNYILLMFFLFVCLFVWEHHQLLLLVLPVGVVTVKSTPADSSCREKVQGNKLAEHIPVNASNMPR